MLIKEVSEDIAVIVVNNNKVPNFPLKKALWNVCGSCSHYKTLAMGMFFWSCSSHCSPHGNGFALFAFYFIFIYFFFLYGTICTLEFGRASPLGPPLAEGSRRNHSPASFFQQPKQRMLQAWSHLWHIQVPWGAMKDVKQWHFKDLQASRLASDCYRRAGGSLYSCIRPTHCRQASLTPYLVYDSCV